MARGKKAEEKNSKGKAKKEKEEEEEEEEEEVEEEGEAQGEEGEEEADDADASQSGDEADGDGDKENGGGKKVETKADGQRGAKRKAEEGGGGGGAGEAGGGRAGKKGKGDDDAADAGDAHSRVLSYLRRANRPYSTTVLYENLHHEIGKAALQRLLDELTAQSQTHTLTRTRTLSHSTQRTLGERTQRLFLPTLLTPTCCAPPLCREVDGQGVWQGRAVLDHTGRSSGQRTEQRGVSLATPSLPAGAFNSSLPLLLFLLVAAVQEESSDAQPEQLTKLDQQAAEVRTLPAALAHPYRRWIRPPLISPSIRCVCDRCVVSEFMVVDYSSGCESFECNCSAG